ncbi:lysophospholipid acyltransferase 2 isoform X1 [Pongo abelii]|uniref:lysophospholipid acyltransferase 2 isoform X1 n=3 Tax=Pongo abelii TaxID=9601 RepID=UPI0023E772BC|nr:lysophospholipid acyltransferase 2 isoform X1 [Pongo abelii]
MATTSTTGSTLLQPLSNAVQLPIDQVNFVVCQLFALLAAIWFRTYLHSSKTSSFIRHVVATLLGLYLALFCFGWYALHFLVQSGISYCIMIIIGVENMHNYCFVFALGYLTVCQVTRVYIFDYGQYSADFSGPMMIITQKITSLACEIHDGMFRKDEELTSSQRDLAVRRMPSLLEYLSYNCNFMGILAGPLCSYKDYITFIEGRSYHITQSGENGKEETQYERTEPSPNAAVIQKLLVCGLSLLFHLTVCATLPVEYNIDEHFQATASWPTKIIYLYISLLAARPKYYFAWTLADAINNAAGFGFRGYDKNGAARWDLISNLRIQQIEMSTSFKMFLDNWNIQTALWLKRVCYERTSFIPTIQTFILSAIWHGVYPGYYLTFLTGVLMTLAARAMRNNFRHYFIEPSQLKLFYDVITWIVTQVAISYTVVPFVLLSIKPSFTFYSSWYYCLHILGILVLLLLPVKKTQRRKNIHENVQLSQSKKFDEGENSLGWNSFSTTNNVCNQNQEIASRHSSLKQ